MKTKNVSKIVPVTYDEDLDQLSRANGGIPFVGIEEMSVTYLQPADTNSPSDDVQHLTITSRTACAVGTDEAIKRDGFYFDVTIPEGEHWSVDDGEGLAALVEDFRKRLYMGVEYLNDKPKTKEE